MSRALRTHRLSHHLRRFAAVATIAAALLAPGTHASAAQVPEGHFGTAEERAEGSNPSLAGKLVGYWRYVRAAGHAPSVLIVGSSRAMSLDPRLVYAVSGQRAFNASVSDAAAREGLAVTSFARLVTPMEPPHLVIVFEPEQLDRRAATRRVRTVLASEDTARGRCHFASTCVTAWHAAAAGIVRDAAYGIRNRPDIALIQRTDGLIKSPALARHEREGVDMAALRRHRIALRIASYRPGGGFDRIMPVPTASIRRTIALANSWGDVPVVVLPGMHPECIRRCGPAGWTARRRAALRTLRSFQPQLRFRLYDFSDPATWGGSGASFYEEIHLRPRGAAQVVRALQARDAFRSIDG